MSFDVIYEQDVSGGAKEEEDEDVDEKMRQLSLDDQLKLQESISKVNRALESKNILSQWASKNSVWASWVLKSNEDGNGGIIVTQVKDPEFVETRRRDSLKGEHSIVQSLERKYQQSSMLNEGHTRLVRQQVQGSKEEEEERNYRISRLLNMEEMDQPESLMLTSDELSNILDRYEKEDEMIDLNKYSQRRSGSRERSKPSSFSSSHSSSSSSSSSYASSPHPRKKETSHKLPDSKQWRALVAMDKSTPAFLAKRVLSGEGVDVTISSSIYGLNDLYIEEAEAVKNSQQQVDDEEDDEGPHTPFSFILLDYNLLPEKLIEDILDDGENFRKVEESPEELKMRSLRHYAQYPIPIVLCLPTSMESRTEEFLAMGVRGVLVFPLGSRDILTAVKPYCEGFNPRLY
jgi:CheY-like chemotaxis protein